MKGFGIQAHEIVSNFISANNTHFVDEPELNPLAYAEQFVDPNANRAQTAEELLSRARLIVATELGKDPLLRQEMRNIFKSEALVSVLPTERGVNKIDEHHPYFVCLFFSPHHRLSLNGVQTPLLALQNFKYLKDKRAVDMLPYGQFLHILAAEAEHLVTVSVTLPAEAKASFERRLNDAFASDSFSDTARAWNEERSRVIQETLDQHLIPVGVKWTREWIREEEEEHIASQCAHILRNVSCDRTNYCHVNPFMCSFSGSTLLRSSHRIYDLGTWLLFWLYHGARVKHTKTSSPWCLWMKPADCESIPN